ncbi:hypothetical protein V7075_17755 [Neobacillus drentensis]|uniref:hypothetical protein n=1 Tax=Neobacillus drentensis TaxID=220684 RepID=UPI002FFFFE40
MSKRKWWVLAAIAWMMSISSLHIFRTSQERTPHKLSKKYTTINRWSSKHQCFLS